MLVKVMIVILMIIKTKAVAQRCSVKRVFLEMPRACNLIKKEPLGQVFSCEFREISKNTFSYRTPLVVASNENNQQQQLPEAFSLTNSFIKTNKQFCRI